MRVDPVHAAVGTFFNNSPMFRVPKYQRSYAWEASELEDYLKDLEEAFTKRKNGTPMNHFFGGMVSVESTVTGVVNQKRHELVDGQQRCATFVLTVAAVIKIYKNILVDAISNGDTLNEGIISSRIDRLTKRFIEFSQEVNRQTHIVESLILSKADMQFFKETVRNLDPTPTRESHRKIELVYTSLISKINSLIPSTSSIVDKLDSLEILQLVLDSDFSIIHIVTYDTQEAYKLFQVLNDRGKSLTEGDLLRAKTLELLEGYTTQQDSTESKWDQILMEKSKSTENYLRWIYQSHKGVRAGRNTLFDDSLSYFYPQHSNTTITIQDADNILEASRKILDEIKIARKISMGTWPFSTSSRPITGWDRNRLNLLIRELGLTVSLPLLLASYHLGERKFSEITQILELFLFKYKVISNAHIEAAVSVFHSHCLLIRANVTTYNVSTLRADLNALMSSKVTVAQFRAGLDGLAYKVGGGNKPLKYLLMTLEHYKRWYEQGANNTPECLDKTRIYDFTSTTIEHVYPRNASGNVLESTLEPLKNSLENLTFMGSADNETGSNDSFAIKLPIFQASSIGLNLDIGTLTQWTTSELGVRKTLLKDMACAIFTI
ncbi:DUF262 domain-containing protein [Winogradskyella sp. F6397]|uniref:DUF262 domain-containing protein n=1 Tax=Winogradskyella marina TaxID=2785530 RepID=A0ABS0EFW0_9FLAO|nr:DUF262 domain-containing protein [Winogradskyella marina]MBF8149071.1 DUF262 domain-containing protein [Winogradskyella marina]